jgi:hypothetical protein
VLHDAFGVYQQLLSVDLGIPINPRPPTGSCLGRTPAPVSRTYTVQITFFPSF